eukprot:scaffold380731_cov59-Attheya_sp.AAC.2
MRIAQGFARHEKQIFGGKTETLALSPPFAGRRKQPQSAEAYCTPHFSIAIYETSSAHSSTSLRRRERTETT